MAYLVMARKWRPRNFEEMVGQEHIARTLRNAIESKRIAHAYLFTGTRGVGKTTSARILAKALNCEKGPTPIPCEVCESCKAIGSGTSMDVLEIDGASNRGVGEIRELREQVKYAPMQGGYKVYIIDEVHMLTKEAFNALLKTLEEPPAHVVFLFATTEANKVPHTILSRVQRFDFKRISEPMIRGRLEFICQKEDISFETPALEAIARKADGSMRDALSLFDQVIAFSGSTLGLEDARRILGLPPDELFAGLLDAVVSHDAKSCYDVVEKVVGEGLELGEFLLGFGNHLRDSLFARQEGMTAQALGFAENRFLELRGSHADLRDGDLIRYAKIVSDILGGLKGAAHPRMHVEMGLLRLASLDRIATLSQLMRNEPSLPESPMLATSAGEEKKKNLIPPRVIHSPPSQEAAAMMLPDATPDSAVALADPEDEPFGRENEETEDFAVGDEEMAPLPHVETHAETLTFSSPQELVMQWPGLVQEVAGDPSLMSMHLSHSQIQFDEENKCFELDVTHAVALDFFQGKGDGRRKLQSLFQERLPDSTPLEIKVKLIETHNPATPAGTAPVSTAPRGHLADEPIVKTLLDLFDGRILSNGLAS